MFDISFILPCNNSSPDIGQTIDVLSSVLRYSNNVEILVVSTATTAHIFSQIERREKDYPDNILIVNIEDTDPDDCSYAAIGLSYSDSYCYTVINEPLVFLSPAIFDNLCSSGETCDDDKLKYIKDKYRYIALGYDRTPFCFDQKNEMAQLTDYRDNAGSIDLHYFFQDIYIANKISKSGIRHVYDIGSRVDGFISHLLSMEIGVTMIDIRPLPVKIDNLDFIMGDATDLSNISSSSIPTLSCLHALEHFGLGRYGDPVDFDGWRRALNAFKRIVANDGYLYLSVPVGQCETVMFNAHRIFDPMTIIKNLVPTFKLIEFTLLHDGIKKSFCFDKTESMDNIACMLADIQNNHMGLYDCGIFIFKKA